MKDFISYNQRNTALNNVFDTYSAVLQDKTGMMAGIPTFKDNNSRIDELLAIMSRPRTVIFLPRRSNAERLRVLTRRISGVGIHIADVQKDIVKQTTYRQLQSGVKSSTYWQLWQLAKQVQTEIGKEAQATITGAGLKAETQSEFADLIQNFGLSMDTTMQEMQQRSSARQELKSLLRANNALMRNNFDQVINLLQESNPDLYRDYRIARRSPLAHKSSPATSEVTAEVSGVVINAADNSPVAGATLLIADLNLNATTDEDGYFNFEEVPAGSFSLSCTAKGYKVPADAALTITDGSDQILDFSLEAEAEKAAA